MCHSLLIHMRGKIQLIMAIVPPSLHCYICVLCRIKNLTPVKIMVQTHKITPLKLLLTNCFNGLKQE